MIFQDLKNGIMQASEITNQNNLLAVDFRPPGNRVFDFSTNLCATIMLQKMMDFLDKNFNSSLKIIRNVVNNIRQVKMITRFMMEIICEIIFYLFLFFIV